MAIKFISVKCPECGASLEIEEGRKKAFCSYCGAKVLIYDDNHHEYVYRSIDEAGLKHAEVRLKELEYEEKTRKSKIRWTISLIIANALIIGLSEITKNDTLTNISIGLFFVSMPAIIRMWTNNKNDDN